MQERTLCFVHISVQCLQLCIMTGPGRKSSEFNGSQDFCLEAPSRAMRGVRLTDCEVRGSIPSFLLLSSDLPILGENTDSWL